MQIQIIDPPLRPTVTHPHNRGIHNSIIVGRRPIELDNTPVTNEPPNCPRLLKLAKPYNAIYSPRSLWGYR